MVTADHNYDNYLYRFRDKVRHWSKWQFFHTACIPRSCVTDGQTDGRTDRHLARAR